MLFVGLGGGGSVVAWQTFDGITYQRYDKNSQAVGTPTTIPVGHTGWLTASPIASGGFTLAWSTSADTAPTAQDFDANGGAVGSTYTLDSAPSASTTAFTTRDENATHLFADGGYVEVTTPAQSGTITVQRYDSAGNPVGSEFQQTGLFSFDDVKIHHLAGGEYLLSYRTGTAWASQLVTEAFAADGTHLGSGGIAGYAYAGGDEFPRVGANAFAALPDGGYVASWIKYDSSAERLPSEVYVQEFSASGAPLGEAQFLGIATRTTFEQDKPIIDVFPDGHYVVSWPSPEGPESAEFFHSGTPVVPGDNDHIETYAVNYVLPPGPHESSAAGAQAQAITGNAQDNVLYSNDHATTLDGAGGDDTLHAGRQANVLTGGDGADVFVFEQLPWNAGQITDFALGTDTLDLSALIAASGYAGDDLIGDGYLHLDSDGAGGTNVSFDSDGPGSANPWPIRVTTLLNVAPAGLTAEMLFAPDAPPSEPPDEPPPGEGESFTADDSPNQMLTGGTGDDVFFAGRNSVVMTGGEGADRFVFEYLPWNAGRITDFALGSDALDLSALIAASGYTGDDLIGDGYLRLDSDGAGGTKLYYDSDGPGSEHPWPIHITTLEGVSPQGLTPDDLFAPDDTPPDEPPDEPPPSGGETLTADDSRDQVLTGGPGDDIFLTGHNSVILTGGDGADQFVFEHLPWNNTGHIRDFTTDVDILDLRALFDAAGYSGSDPIGDGYLHFNDIGTDTEMAFDPDGHGTGNPWPATITTLDGVQPSGIKSSDWLFA